MREEHLSVATPLTHAERERDARLAREAAALRENLRRRKRQTRARDDQPDRLLNQGNDEGDEPS